jgi:peptidyl-prolyl cis-trans isomerase A (cyclophilin A)
MYNMKLVPALLAGLIVVSLAFSTGCAAKSADSSGAAPVRVQIVTSDGTIVAALDPAHAPGTVANFLRYVDAKFFDGGTFFRAVPGFVIQGGNKAKEASGYPAIQLEDPQATGLKNVDGALAMARTSDPNSATSEFFIDQGAQPVLDGGNGAPGYAVFGNVVSGMDVVAKIISGEAQDQMLVEPVKIIKIERIK